MVIFSVKFLKLEQQTKCLLFSVDRTHGPTTEKPIVVCDLIEKSIGDKKVVPRVSCL